MSQTDFRYRPDIDGLRSVAVLAVLLFHAFPTKLPGGFIGVDIFFVISGYLISGILYRELEAKTFSLTSFYARRIKRIFPALCAVVLSCLMFGWVALFPSEYLKLGQHAVAGLGFCANLLLWREAGYFDVSAEAKPFLHLWSLGIEEQFYFFWPICLLLTWRWKGRFKLYLFLFAASFLGSLSASYHSEVEAFFSPLTRMWELLVGAFLAYLQFKRSDVAERFVLCSSFHATVVSGIGFAILLASCLCISKQLPFPGWSALLPTLGASLVIIANQRAWVNRVILSNNVMVGIGLISYPLYLWHWPLLSFGHIVGRDSLQFRMLMVAVSFLLAWATYAYLEKPFRSGRVKHPVVVLIFISLILAATGYVIYFNQGFPQRQNSNFNHEGTGFRGKGKSCDVSFAQEQGLDLCVLPESGEPDIAVVGDSHAQRYFLVLSEMDSSRKYAMVGKTGGSAGIHRIHSDKLLLEPSIKTIIFTYEQDKYAVETGEMISVWIAGGKNVIFVFDNPRLPVLPKECDPRRFSSPRFPEECLRSRAEEIARTSEVRKQIASLRLQYGNRLVSIDALDSLCGAKFCFYAEKNIYLYDDEAHLSREGAAKVGKEILEVLGKF